MKTQMPCWGEVLAIVAMMLLVSGIRAQTTNCTLANSSLTPCLSYVEGNDTTPSPQCCSGISSLNTNDPDCLCQIVNQFNSGTTSGVNTTEAFTLPSQCGVIVTVECPVVSVRPTVPTPSTPRTPGGGGTVPSDGDDSSSGAAPHRLDLFVAFTALLAVTHLVWSDLIS